jgi:hypothetical protein
MFAIRSTAARPPVGRVLRGWFRPATAFTATGAFLAAYGAGVHDGLIEAAGGALLGAASLAFLIGFRRLVEPEARAGRGASERPRA